MVRCWEALRGRRTSLDGQPTAAPHGLSPATLRVHSLTSLLSPPDNVRFFPQSRIYKERYVASASSTAPAIRQGVAPLRAGQGYSFLLRRLHSLSGIVPVGLFLIEHFISNAFATRGPAGYTKQVELLSSFPFVVGLELFGIWLPILYHALYGFYIWYRGEGNVGEYPWTGNWLYTSQRWTGTIAFFYMVWHT